VLTYTLLGIAALVVVTVLVWGANRHDRTDETERFRHARELTSRWSAEGVRDPEPAPKPRWPRVARRHDQSSAA
jgi:hypothetical protein